MKLYTKDQIIQEITNISNSGWHKSIKETRDTRNDGAVGNTLEDLLGIEENNLPIPNAREWELKGQRSHTSSLVTLKHMEPSPNATKIVPRILLPFYGWKHKQAGKKYSANEMSFRSTTNAITFTNRGFKVVVNHVEKKVCFIFDSYKVDLEDPQIRSWFATVEKRIGLGPINPEPYWGFDDLKYAIGTKMKNCFYTVADTKVNDGHEYFKYIKLFVLSGFSFNKFLEAIEDGSVLIDFDARTGHNHGTKFRLKQGSWAKLYSDVEEIF